MNKLCPLATALLLSFTAYAQDAVPDQAATTPTAAAEVTTSTPVTTEPTAPVAAPATESASPTSAEPAPTQDYAAEPAAMASGLYGELGYTSLKLVANDYNVTAKPTMLRAVVGKDFYPYLSGEIMMGVGLNSKQVVVPGSSQAYNFEVKTLLGLYAVPKIRLGDQFEAYARLGLAAVGAHPDTDPNTGLSWGLGAAYRFSGNFSANIDHMVYFKKDNLKVDGTTLSLGYKF